MNSGCQFVGEVDSELENFDDHLRGSQSLCGPLLVGSPTQRFLDTHIAMLRPGRRTIHRSVFKRAARRLSGLTWMTARPSLNIPNS